MELKLAHLAYEDQNRILDLTRGDAVQRNWRELLEAFAGAA